MRFLGALRGCPGQQVGALETAGDQSHGKVDLGLPLFPTTEGETCTKSAVTDTMKEVARLAGLALSDDMGRRRFTGHPLRVTGAQHLAS
eukprot:6136886-Amphidinium_carterae.1